MKKKRVVISVVIIGILLLFPCCFRLKDGGSKEYRSIVGIYEVKIWKQMGYTEETGETLKTGTTVRLFGIKVFDNTKTEATGYEEKPGNSMASLGKDSFELIGTEKLCGNAGCSVGKCSVHKWERLWKIIKSSNYISVGTNRH